MRRSGLSLIETLLGVAILLLAVVMCFSLLPSSWLAVNQGEQRIYAGTLAQSILEQQQSYAFDSIAPATLPPVEEAGTQFKPAVFVNVPTPGPTPRLKVVTVNVTWESRKLPRFVSRQVTVCRVPR